MQWEEIKSPITETMRGLFEYPAKGGSQQLAFVLLEHNAQFQTKIKKMFFYRIFLNKA